MQEAGFTCLLTIEIVNLDLLLLLLLKVLELMSANDTVKFGFFFCSFRLIVCCVVGLSGNTFWSGALGCWPLLNRY